MISAYFLMFLLCNLGVGQQMNYRHSPLFDQCWCVHVMPMRAMFCHVIPTSSLSCPLPSLHHTSCHVQVHQTYVQPLMFPPTFNFQKPLILSNQVSIACLSAIVSNSASPSYSHQPSEASHFECHYFYVLYRVVKAFRSDQ